MSDVRNGAGYIVLLLAVFLSVSKSTTIRVRKSTKEKITNLDFVKKVSQEIGDTIREINSFKVVVVKSTVPPTTT